MFSGFDKLRPTYTVSQLTSEIREILEGTFPSVSVEGEVSDFLCARSGHWYFTLKDEDARISCVMFRGQNRLVREQPKDGAQLTVRGRLNVYPPRGNYQLVADSMIETGAGRLHQLFEELKARLQEEGLFDEALKRPLPLLPNRVALVTSPEGAAVQDMIRVMTRRNPDASIVVVPTLVQGTQAPQQIVKAINTAASLPEVDVIVVGRGGGSIEDLWAFNDEQVARAIRACPVPVVSAVGHEVDFTIADFVADLRAATPSVAGELVMPVVEELKKDLFQNARRLHRAITQLITHARLDLRDLESRLPSPSRRVTDYRMTLDALTRSLTDAMTDRIHDNRETLAAYRSRLVLQHPGRNLERRWSRLEKLSMRMQGGMRQYLTEKENNFRSLAGKLDAMSPLAVLGRGYSLVSLSDGSILREAAQVSVGDSLVINPAVGELEAQVTRIQSEDEKKEIKG